VRRIKKQPTTADILLDIAFIRRHPEELVQHWAGIGVGPAAAVTAASKSK